MQTYSNGCDDREMMIQIHSDCWKDVYGTRPRKDWTGIPYREIEAETDKLSIELTHQMHLEERLRDEEIEFNIKYGAFEDRWARFQDVDEDI